MTANELTRLAETATRENAAELELIARRFGARNCWTGTLGVAAGKLLEAVKGVNDED